MMVQVIIHHILPIRYLTEFSQPLIKSEMCQGEFC